MPQFPGADLPRVDVFEREGHLVVKAELPGVKKDDIDSRSPTAILRAVPSGEEEHEVKRRTGTGWSAATAASTAGCHCRRGSG